MHPQAAHQLPRAEDLGDDRHAPAGRPCAGAARIQRKLARNYADRGDEERATAAFLHTWIVSGAGASVRNSERGSYRITSGALELRLGSTASGFVTPGYGGRTTVSTGITSFGGESISAGPR